MRGVLLAALLLAACCAWVNMARAGEPETQATDTYRLEITATSNRLLMESSLTLKAGNIISLTSTQGGSGERESFSIFIQPPGVTATEIEQSLAEFTQGQKPRPWSCATQHGLTYYWYCLDADWVSFELYETKASADEERYIGTIRVATSSQG